MNCEKTLSSFSLAFILLLIACASLTVDAQTPEFSWARQMGGTLSDKGASITTDASGNSYSTGEFRGTADFDPGAGTFNLTATDGDIYILKLDTDGNFVWAKSIGGTNADVGLSITNRTGNIYISGSFSGTVDFDPGAGVTNLSNGDSDDEIFVLKLDANGNFVWARSMGGVGENDFSFGIAVDASDNVYTTGEFRGTADFNPGAGVFNLTAGGIDPDVFVSKLDVNGNFVWAKSFEGPTDSGYAYDITVDATGNVYTIGDFVGTVDFDPGAAVFNLTAASGGVFISKLDVNGIFVWAKHVGSAGGFSIAVDNTGNVYATGGFSNTPDFDPGAGTFNFTSQGSADIYVLKLNSTGNFVWAKAMGGSGHDAGYALDIDASGVYTTGWFNSTVDFDPGASTFNLTSAGLLDIFIVKLDPSGAFAWAVRMGNANQDAGYNIDIDGSGNVYTTGAFNATVDFDPGAGTTNLASAGSDEIFIQKLLPAVVSVPIITINPQPTSTAVCDGSVATFALTASGAANLTYQWQKFDGAIFNNITNTGGYSGTTTSTLTINTTGNFGGGDYRCKVAGDLATDKFSNTVTLTVNSVPAAPATTGDSDCVPASLTLTASGASNGQYRWYAAQTGGSPIAAQVNSTYATPVISTTTTYYAAINNGLCESVRTAVIATIAPLGKPSITFDPPIFNAGSTINICDGDVQKFVAPPGFEVYSWSSGESSDEITITTGGTYTVTVEDVAGCISPPSDPVTVVINSYPLAEITVNGSQLIASTGDTYQWYQNGSEISGATDGTFNFNVLEFGEYIVDVTDNGCTSTSDSYLYLITATENFQNGWKIHPNPFDDAIHIETPSEDDFHIEIIDVLGRSVKEFTGKNNQLLDLHELKESHYIMAISTDKRTFHFRIIKKK